MHKPRTETRTIRRLSECIVITALLAAAPMSGQTAPGERGPFTAYDQIAARALDRVLTDILETPGSAATIRADQVVAAPDVNPSQSTEKISEEAVAAFANQFWNGRTEDLRKALERLSRIRPALEAILAQEGIPPEFAAVVLVESGASPFALSPKAARGLWQFEPATAGRYGLVVSDARDDRTDLFRSTHAAAQYLRDLYRSFGEWQLALAAYNAGEGALKQAIERARSSDFRILSDQRLIPAETRNYVPAVLAAVNLLEAR